MGTAIKNIANIQHNRFLKKPNVLGQVNVCEEMKEVEHLDFHDIDDRSKLSQLVKKLTKTFLISFLILSNLVKLK
jgi:formiminoglutamase